MKNSTKVQQAWKWLWSYKWISYVNNKKEHMHTTAADLNINNVLANPQL